MKQICILVVWLSILFGQHYPRTESQIIEEWQDYTAFQREELLSFCDFLFENEYYDRAQINLFRYLYKYPDKTFEPVLYYYIARSYEEEDKYDLALEYYSRITTGSDSSSLVYQSSMYRTIYMYLENKDYENVWSLTKDSDDPYHLVFRGYAYLNTAQWTEAKKVFTKAKRQFDHNHYSRLLKPLVQSIDAVNALPKKNKTLAVGLSVIPGGGQSYLKQWKEAAGVITTSVLLYLFTTDEVSSSAAFTYQNPGLIPSTRSIVNTSQGWKAAVGDRLPITVDTRGYVSSYIVPPVVLGLGVYAGSIIKTWDDIDKYNHQSEMDFIQFQLKKYPVSRFIDFYEPELR